MKEWVWFALLAAALSVVLVTTLDSLPPEARPQRTSGDDVLSVAFGDAKSTIGRAMVQKADSYFHGGVDMDGHHDCLHHDHDEYDADHHDRSGDSVLGDSAASRGLRDGDHRVHGIEQVLAFDPWKWINTRIRAPQIERHLEGKRSVELIPWLWAAVKANPKDTDTWTTAWYIAARQMKDTALARSIAAEGLRLNPQALDVACTVGRGYRDCEPRDSVRAEAAFRKAHEIALGKCGGDLSKLKESDLEPFLEILNFLSSYEYESGAKEALGKLLSEARMVNPNHIITIGIAESLNKLQ